MLIELNNYIYNIIILILIYHKEKQKFSKRHSGDKMKYEYVGTYLETLSVAATTKHLCITLH